MRAKKKVVSKLFWIKEVLKELTINLHNFNGLIQS